MRCRAASGWPAVLLGALPLLAASTRSSADIAWNVSAGLGETDNVRLTPTDQQADTISELGADIAWHEQRRTFNADVTGDLSYLDYLHHYYKSEVIGNFIGNLQFTLLPQVLRWTFSDNFGQGIIDPLAQVTPSNREYINYFSTGPDLTLPLGSLNALLVDARYSKVTYQTSPLGNERYSANVGVRRELSASTDISVNVRDELIRFDDSILNPDYDQQEAYLRFDAHGARTRLEIEVGFDRLKLQNGSNNGVLARLEATRQLSPSASVVATIGHEYSDAGQDFRTLQALGGATLATQSVQPTADPFKNDYATLEWNYQRNRTGLGFGGGYFKETYQAGQGLDENRLTFDAHASRRLTPNIEATLMANYERDNFYDVLGNSTLGTVSGLLTWRASRMVSVVLEYDHARRESDLRTTEYTDNRGWLKIRYGRTPDQPPGSFVPAPPLPPLPNESRYQ
jgi:hypothetical protein